MITLLATPGSLKQGTTVSLDATEAHHLRVRRGGEKEEIRLVDGEGTVGYGGVDVSNHGAHVTLDRIEKEPLPPAFTLAVGAGDKDRFLWLAEKATELEVTTLIPIETTRTHSVATRVRDGHIDRIKKRALEALKQSGGAWAPQILPPVSLDRFLGERREGQCFVLNWEGEALPADLEPGEGVTALVGPEGGFTPEELQSAIRAGFRRASLGRKVLRFETAALAVAAWAGIARRRSTP
ncbi:MAG TPA: RsmE family RNA methyltransferase [Gemmatimonadales bacterium]|nr:RsmE family RNA methyltransferase [Gemmatimonadales bacterium]